MSTPNISRAQWADLELATLGIPPSSAAVNDLVAWAAAEGGWWNNPDTFNPLNTTEPASGSVPTNSVGVRAYPDLQTGLQATADALKNTRIDGADPYTAILSDLSSGAGIQQFAADVGASPWGTSAAGILGAAAAPAAGNGVQLMANVNPVSGAGSIDLNPVDAWKNLFHIATGAENTVINAAGSAVSSAASSVGSSIAKDFLRGLMAIVFVVAAIGLMVLGLWKLFK